MKQLNVRWFVIATVLASSLAQARITEIAIERVEPVFDGARFGRAGAYEKVVGRAFGEVDPDDPLNREIVNIDKAPRNKAGRVRYAVDIYLLKPVDLRRGNHRIFYNVLNRGNKQALGFPNFNDAITSNENEPTTLADAGNGFLMRYGYVVLWSAWQGDVPAGGGRMLASFPVATDDGKPIVGLNRDEFVFDNTTDPATAALSYPAETLDPSQASLTAREREQDPRIALPSGVWTYLSPTQIQISRPPQLDAGAIYEFIYPARDPIVMAMGFAAMRDVVSFLRWQSHDDLGNPNPLNIEGAPSIRHVYAFGSSQSGRYLRDMLWQGFIEDEDGRRVFDGIIPHKAGSRKTFTNFEFSQPGRFSRQHEDHLYGGDQFPFTYETRFDSISEKTDGLLVRCRDSNTCPKIMHTDTGTEPWLARSSLVVTDEFGSNDIALPSNVRTYYFSSTQHGPSLTPELGICQQFSNPAPFSPALRALLVALDRWVSDGLPPPASRFPRIDDGTLVPSFPQSEQGFPEIPGVTYSGLVNELSELDTSVQPPAPIPGHDYVVLVPKVDADGNDLAGIRLPGIEAPLGTFTGWNLRRAGFAEGELCSLTGSFIPLARTQPERREAGDPRLSVEERYGDHRGYVRAVARAAQGLEDQRLLLAEDVERYIAQAQDSEVLR